MESLLSKQPGLAENLLKNCAVAFFVIDATHHVIFWNKACEHLTGIPASEVLGTNNQWMAFHDHLRPCLSDMLLEGREDQVIEHYGEYKKSVLLPDGVHAEGWFTPVDEDEKFIIVDAAPIYDKDKNLIAAVETLQDITEIKLLQDENEKLISDLRQALGSLKTLQGLIPICSTCKKIRDDKGYWNKLENYLEAHSSAEFKHSLCPACEELFYLSKYKD